MKQQQQHIDALLCAEMESAALSQLKGGALAPIISDPHDLITPADRSVPYDGNVDDVSELETP